MSFLNNSRSDRSKKQNSPTKRSLRVESLENREMLSISPLNADGFEDLKGVYDNLNWGDTELTNYNVIELSGENITAASLAEAIAKAKDTEKIDLIVVHTTATNNTIQIESALAITDDTIIVSMGTDPLKLSGGSFSMAVDKEFQLGGITLSEASEASAVAVTEGTVTITKSTFTNNGSGAISIEGGSILVTNSVVANNSSSLQSNVGGAVYAKGGKISVIDSVVYGNRAGSGAGVYQEGGVFEVDGCTVYGNDTYSGDDDAGGGLYLKAGTMTVKNSTISGNSSYKDGGGLYQVDGTLNVINSVISGNAAFNSGSVVYFGGGETNVTNCTFAGNIGKIYYGNELIDYNNIFAFNYGEEDYSEDESLNDYPDYGYNLYTFWFETTAGAAAELAASDSLVSKITNSSPYYSLMDPKFAKISEYLSNATISFILDAYANGTADLSEFYRAWSPEAWKNWDLRLQTTSPAKDKGSDAKISGEETDILGNARIQGKAVDMGAYESGTAFTLAAPKVTGVLLEMGEYDFQARLDWGGVANAKAYEVLRYNSAKRTWQSLGMTTVTQFVDPRAEIGDQYQVKAVSGGLFSAASATVKMATAVTEAPSIPLAAPSGVKAAAGPFGVVISWNAVAGADAYNVYRILSDGSAELIKSRINATTFTDSGLVPETNYKYCVTASKNFQETSASATVSATTVKLAAPKITSAVAGLNAVLLNWSTVDGATEYDVYQVGIADPIKTVSGTSHTVTGLTATTKYSFQIVAKYVAGEESEQIVKSSAKSAAVSVSTKTAPEATKLAAKADGMSKVDLTWTAPQLADAQKIEYVLTVKDAKGVPVGEAEYDTPVFQGASVSVTGLKASTKYSFTIQTKYYSDMEGEEVLATTKGVTVSATTAKFLAVKNFKPIASETGLSTVTLQWDEHVDATDDYEITVTTKTKGAVTPSAELVAADKTSATISGLTPGAAYTFKIVAKNTVAGESAAASVSATTKIAPEVTKPTAKADGMSKVDLTWAAPVPPAGATIKGYLVTYPGLSDPIEVAKDKLGCKVEMLAAGTKYTFTVKTIYELESDDSDVTSKGVTASATTAKFVAVKNFKPIASATGLSTVELQWDEHVDATDGYEITVTSKTKGAAIPTVGPIVAGTTSVEIDGLTAGAAYTFKIVAKNSEVEGTSAAATTSVTMKKAPVPKLSLVKNTTTYTEMTLQWAALTMPVDVDSEEVVYTLQVKGPGEKEYTDVTDVTDIKAEVDDEARTFEVTGLAAGTTYSFRMVATYKDSDETTLAEATSGAISAKTTVFAAPTGVKKDYIGLTDVGIEFKAKDNTDYELWWSTDNKSWSKLTEIDGGIYGENPPEIEEPCAMVGVSSEGFGYAEVFGLDAGTTYYFRVRGIMESDSDVYADSTSLKLATAVAQAPKISAEAVGTNSIRATLTPAFLLDTLGIYDVSSAERMIDFEIYFDGSDTPEESTSYNVDFGFTMDKKGYYTGGYALITFKDVATATKNVQVKAIYNPFSAIEPVESALSNKISVRLVETPQP